MQYGIIKMFIEKGGDRMAKKDPDKARGTTNPPAKPAPTAKRKEEQKREKREKRK